MLTRLLALLTLVGFAALPSPVRAGDNALSRGDGKAPVAAERDPFAKGRLELQVMSGLIFSLQNTSASRPNIDYALAVVRGGVMLDNPNGPGLLRGNDEFLLEAVGGGIFQGPGSGLAGLSLMYRRNFLGFGRGVVPFVDLGTGGVYSDAYHQFPQKTLGSPFEFDLQAGIGLRLLLRRGWSIDLETDFRHLSNANLASRNNGTNGLGGLLGFSKSF